MRLEAIYNQGKLEFNPPLQFRHSRFAVKVDVPEQEITDPKMFTLPSFDLSIFSTQVLAEIARLEAIQQAALDRPITKAVENEEEQLRWAAFSLRNESRREQGRIV